MRKLVVFSIVIFGLHFGITGQVQLPPSISQYMFNPMSSNPGYAGFYDMVIGSNLFRSSLRTKYNFSNTLNVHSSLPLDNLGAGINIHYDKVGITTATSIDLALSYKLSWGDNKLSFGAQGTFFNTRNDFSLLEYGKDNNSHQEQFTPDGNNSFSKPNFGMGIMYSGRKFFGGVSAPRLLAITEEISNVYTVQSGTVDTTLSSRFNPFYTISVGTVLEIKDLVVMKPSFMLKYIEQTGMLLDINYSVLYRQTLWTGISLRNSLQNPEGKGLDILKRINSVALLAQIQLNDKFKAGVSYEIPTNKELFKSSAGVRNPFEIMINYNIAAFEEQGVHTFLY